MLAKTDTIRTDLTAEELTYLIRVRTGLETGEITAEMFEMSQIWCGTAGCLGGWMGHFKCEDNNDKKHKHLYAFIHEQKFKKLFYPTDWKMNCATPADGLRAINNFLADKPRPWGFMKKDGSHAR